MQSYPLSSTSRDANDAAARRHNSTNHDLAYQLMTIAAMAIVLVTVWVF